MSRPGDLYEDDEPIADVVAAFEAGQPVVTVQPPPTTVAAPVKVTEQRRTVAAERDLPRVKQWLTRLVAGAFREYDEALHAVRRYCDQLDLNAVICAERNGGSACGECATGVKNAASFRALLPAVPETSNRRAEHGGEDGDARHESDPGRPGLVTEEEPGGSDTDGG
jgi:hypothetical protein